MKKKILSLVLISMMVLGLVACGKNNKAVTATEFAEKIGGMELYSSNMQLDISDGTDVISVKLNVANSDVNEGSVVVEAKAGTMTDYKVFTTVYVTKDMDIYINAKQLLDFMVSYDSQYAIISSFISLSEDYVSIKKDDIKAMYDQMGEDYSEIEAAYENMNTAEASKLYLELFGNFVDKIKADTEDSVVSVSADKLTVTVNNENVAVFADALSKISFKEVLESENNKSKIDNYDEMVTAVETIDESLKEMADALKEFAATGKIDAKFEWAIKGKNVDTTLDATVEADGNVSTVKLSATSTPDKLSGLSVPDKSVSFIDLMNQLQGN